MFISKHINAFKGKSNGTEVFEPRAAGKKIAQPVVDDIVKLGFVNKGLKSGAFYILKHTYMRVILIEYSFLEYSFLDSSKDIELFDL